MIKVEVKINDHYPYPFKKVEECPGLYKSNDRGYLLSNSMGEIFCLCGDVIEVADEEAWKNDTYKKVNGTITITVS